MRTFEYSDVRSHKFWNIDLQGKSFTVHYGRIGSAGQMQTKEFADEAAARKEHDKLVAEKVKKGYRETTAQGVPAAVVSSHGEGIRAALESALVENPDDLASHMAYADWLQEHGDPLGEFIQVQLALEDESRSAADRKKLQEQEKQLLKAHQRHWLGDLAPFLLDQKPEKGREWNSFRVQWQLRRGWLDMLDARRFTVAFSRALARAPQTRLLRHLVLADEAYEEEGEYERGPDIPASADGNPQLYPLVPSPYLGNVRIFQLGESMTPQEEEEADDGGFSCHTDGEAAIGLIKRMPKLEELYLLAHNVDTKQLFALQTLSHLRILQVYHNNRSYPLDRLAKNPALTRLTHLLFHPHAMDDEHSYIRLPGVRALVRSPHLPALTHLRLRLSDMGDKGCKEIADSGILKRLKVLDLRHGCITDAGALTLTMCPDVKNLELLDLTHNALTPHGISTMQVPGVKIVTDNQWQPSGDEYNDQEYLYAGDIE